MILNLSAYFGVCVIEYGHVYVCMYVCVCVHVCTRFGTYMCNSSVSFEVRCWGTICIHTIHAGGPYGCLYAYLYAYLYVTCDCVENIYGLAGICTPTHTHTHTRSIGWYTYTSQLHLYTDKRHAPFALWTLTSTFKTNKQVTAYCILDILARAVVSFMLFGFSLSLSLSLSLKYTYIHTYAHIHTYTHMCTSKRYQSLPGNHVSFQREREGGREVVCALVCCRGHDKKITQLEIAQLCVKETTTHLANESLRCWWSLHLLALAFLCSGHEALGDGEEVSQREFV